MKSRQKKSHKKSQQTHHRKADISINTIIIAALGLLVLVVLIAVFTGRLGAFNVGIGQQQSDFAKCSAACVAQGNMNGFFADLDQSCSTRIEVPGLYKEGDLQKRCCCNPQP